MLGLLKIIKEGHMDNMREPRGQLSIRTLAMPKDTNAYGDIFGGWIVSQMDLAGAFVAKAYTPKRIVSVAIHTMGFIAPVQVGDFVCCYSEIIKLGTTSIHVNIETWALAAGYGSEKRQVTEGCFVYVAVDENGSLCH